MYLTDILFIEDGNKDKIDGLINFRKCSLLASSLKKIRKFQKKPYQLIPIPELQEYLENIQGISDNVTQERKSVESELKFLNNITKTLTVRTSPSDLFDDRIEIWIDWCEKMSGIENSVSYITEKGSFEDFKSVLRKSNAIQNSFCSAMIIFPQNEELRIFQHLIELTIIPGPHIAELIKILKLAKEVRLEYPQQMALSHLLLSFEKLEDDKSQTNKRKISIATKSTASLAEKSEDFAMIFGKQKKCKRSGIKMLQTCNLIFPNLDRAEFICNLLSNNDDKIKEIIEFLHSKTYSLQKEIKAIHFHKEEVISKQKFLEASKTEETIYFENLTNQQKEQKETLVQLDKDIIKYDNQLNDILQEKTEYFATLDDKINLQKDAIERLDATQQLWEFVINLVNKSSQSNAAEDSVHDDQLNIYCSKSNDFLEKMENSLNSLDSRLTAVQKDIEVMGARYGASIVSTLKKAFNELQQSFQLLCPHIEMSEKNLMEYMSQFPDNGMLNCFFFVQNQLLIICFSQDL